MSQEEPQISADAAEILDFMSPVMEAIYASECKNESGVDYALTTLNDLFENLDLLLDEMEKDNKDTFANISAMEDMLNEQADMVSNMNEFIEKKLREQDIEKLSTPENTQQ